MALDMPGNDVQQKIIPEHSYNHIIYTVKPFYRALHRVHHWDPAGCPV